MIYEYVLKTWCNIYNYKLFCNGNNLGKYTYNEGHTQSLLCFVEISSDLSIFKYIYV